MLCAICQQVPEAIVRHDTIPFIDGKNYELICHTCSRVPRSWEYNTNGEIIFYGYMDHTRLATVDILVQEGWDAQVALCSINAVKKAIKNMKFCLYPSNNYYILAKLYGLDVELSW
jgi:hypothetical protein